MGTLIKVSKLPHLNSVVIKQSGGHFFIAAPNSFIIDKPGFLEIVNAMLRIDFIGKEDLLKILDDGKEGL